MKQPLQVSVPLTKVTPKKPSRMDYSGGPSVVDKNRVEPKTKVTNRTKAPLEVAKPNKVTNNLKRTGQVQKVGYTAPRDEIPFTYQGYPKNRFKGKVQPNVPL